MRSSVLSDAIIFSLREDVIRNASDHLKMKGVNNLCLCESAEDTIEALDRFPKGLLIVDWELGALDAVKVLAFNRKGYAITGRPLLLIAGSVSENLVATAAEYAVSQIFTEAVTAKNLGARLGSLIIAETMGDDVRKALQDVAEKRGNGDHKGALSLLQKTLGKHPTNLRIKCEAAETLLAMNEVEKAHSLLEGMDKTKPPYLRGMHLYGRACMKLGRFEDALRVLQQANLFNAHDAERLVDIGQAMLNMDKINDAGQHFEAALKIDPKLHEAHVGRSQVLLMEDEVNDALAILKGVAGDLEMASVFNTCAVLNMRHKRHEAGMSLYQAALRNLGKDARLQARLYFNMGIGFRRWGKKEKALQCFETSQKLDPNFKKPSGQIEALQAPAVVPARAARTRGGAPGLGDAESSSVDQMPGGGLLDFNTDLVSLLDDDLDEGLYSPPPTNKRA